MNFRIDVYHHFDEPTLAARVSQLEGTMSDLSDKLDNLNAGIDDLGASLDAAVQRIQADVDNLKAKPTVDPADLAKLDASVGKLAAIRDIVVSIDPDKDFPPIPPPEPAPTV